MATGRRAADISLNIPGSGSDNYQSQSFGLYQQLAQINTSFDSSVKRFSLDWMTWSNAPLAGSAGANKQITYNLVSPQSYQEVELDLVTYFRAFRTIFSPLERLNQISALDTGAWASYPLGASPEECTARSLGIPYNNVYATTQGRNGVLQILGAVNTDLLFKFNQYHAGINFNDLRTLFEAVKGYYTAMAASICRTLKLHRIYIPYITALIVVQESFVSVDTDPTAGISFPGSYTLENIFGYGSLYVNNDPRNRYGYPQWNQLDGLRISTLYTVLQYIKEDYSLNETISQMFSYYELARTWINRKFYTQISGDAVKRLGVDAANAQRVLDEVRKYYNNARMSAIDKALNELIRSMAGFSGSTEVLDIIQLPINPSSAIKLEFGGVEVRALVTSYSMAFTSEGAVQANIDFIESLVT